MNSFKKKARIAGALYLVIIVCAGFAEGFVRGGLIVPGDAVTTAQNILASEGLFRAGLAADLIAFLCDAVVAILLYVLLKPVSKTLSLIAAAFRLIAHPAIGSLNLLNHYGALYVLKGAVFSGTFETIQLQSTALLFMDFHNYGYLIAGAFFGIHLLILGYLLYQSELFPKVLGILIVIASFGYLIESFGFTFYPEYETVFATLVGFTAAIGEVALCLWLLIKGVREKQ